MLGPGDRSMTKTSKNPGVHGAQLLEGETTASKINKWSVCGLLGDADWLGEKLSRWGSAGVLV